MTRTESLYDVAIVLGTYNRFSHLKRCITSARQALCSGSAPVRGIFIVIDGGSDDGSREWLAVQPDVFLVAQRGPLVGAVRAFNLGFDVAVRYRAPYILHFNDDCEFMGDAKLQTVLDRMAADPSIGATAFQFNATWFGGKWDVNRFHEHVYSNYGVFRRDTVLAVAKAQGDPSGRNFWNPLYKTYGADVEASAWAWKLGWKIVDCEGAARVCDLRVQDALRQGNNGDEEVAWDRDRIFLHKRWPDAASMDPQEKSTGPERLDTGWERFPTFKSGLPRASWEESRRCVEVLLGPGEKASIMGAHSGIAIPIVSALPLLKSARELATKSKKDLPGFVLVAAEEVAPPPMIVLPKE